MTIEQLFLVLAFRFQDGESLLKLYMCSKFIYD